MIGQDRTLSLKALISTWDDQVLRIAAEIALQPEFSKALEKIYSFYSSEYTATENLNQAIIELEKAVKKGLLQNEIKVRR
jgi:hypothetical protein